MIITAHMTRKFDTPPPSPLPQPELEIAQAIKSEFFRSPEEEHDYQQVIFERERLFHNWNEKLFSEIGENRSLTKIAVNNCANKNIEK